MDVTNVNAKSASAQSIKPFGKSAAIAGRYEFVPEDELRDIAGQYARDIGVRDRALIDEVAQQRIHRATIGEFVQRRYMRLPSDGECARGALARKFLAAQEAPHLLDFNAALKPDTHVPGLIVRALEQGADALFELARGQFDELAQLCLRLRDWAMERGLRNVVLIEAPLGNCVPVAVLKMLLERNGINVTVVEWGCPRNEKTTHGRSVKQSANAIAGLEAIREASAVIYMDDVLTGSRFKKMATALRKKVGEDRTLCVAKRFAFDSSVKQDKRTPRDLRSVDAWGKEVGFSPAVVEFPPLPKFLVDKGPPGVLSTALAWGDNDLVAGKRKVNLIFQFIEQYEAIAGELKQNAGVYRQILEHGVWRQDTDGDITVTPPGLIDQVFDQLVPRMKDDLFERMAARARAEWKDDYLGMSFAVTDEQVKRRTEWLGTALTELLVADVGEGGAMLARAILDLRNMGLVAGRQRASRDHHFGHYTMSYTPGLRTLHEGLVERVVKLAEALDKGG